MYESSSLTTAGVAFTYSQDFQPNNIDDFVDYDPEENESDFDLRMVDLQSSTIVAGPEDTVGRYKRALSTIPLNKPVKKLKQSTASAVIADWQPKRADAIQEKNVVIAEKTALENEYKVNELRLAQRKFNFEKKCRQEELELKGKEINREERLAIKNMELEKKERLATLRMEYDFQLKLKAQSKN